MAAPLGSLLQVAQASKKELACVECGRPVHYVQAVTPYERRIRNRQMIHRLCEQCARTTAEVGEDLDGLRRKQRFLRY